MEWRRQPHRTELALKHSEGSKKKRARLLLQNWSDLLTHQARHPRRVGRQGEYKIHVPRPAPPLRRKSQGPAAETSAVQERDQVSSKETEGGILGPTTGAEKEPSLKDILLAVNNCKSSLSELSDQLKCIKEDLLFLREDVQEVCEWTFILEGRLGQVEDDVNPMKQEKK